MSETWTPRTILDVTRTYLEGRGVAGARLDAELLLAHVLGCSRVGLYTRFDQVLTPAELDRFRPLVKRRAERCPVQYLLGRAEFYALSFEVTPAVLIPRPETETLVELALEHLKKNFPPPVAPEAGTAVPAQDGPSLVHGPSLVDLGSGSGILAITLAVKWPGLRAVGIEISPEALKVAVRNAERHGVAGRVGFLEGSWDVRTDESFRPGKYDMVVCNPPYVARSEAASLQQEVRDFEPPGALFADPSPEAVQQSVVRAAGRILRPGGVLFFEFGFGQEALAGRTLDESHAFVSIRILPDAAGHLRVATGIRSG